MAEGPRPRARRLRAPHLRRPGRLPAVLPPRGGSGNGEQIAANKVKGVRAALAWSEQTAALGREHNNANVISIGGRMHTQEEATKFVEIFLATPYSQEERHQRRIDMLSAYETSGVLPAIPAHHPQQD